MPNKIELQGQQFGKLTVLEEAGRTRFGKVLWSCLCECGRKKDIISGNLVSGKSLSCGVCVKIPDLVGKKFGILTVKEYLGLFSASDSKQVSYWLCEDENGFQKKMSSGQLSTNVRINSIRKYTRHQAKTMDAYRKYAWEAKQKSREFKLTYKEYESIAQSNCSYCGVAPGVIKKSATSKSATYSNGVDRVDSTKGYTLDNVVSCCITCNRGKSNMPIEQWKEYINRLVKFNKETL